MASLLETLKKGLSALNPLGTSTKPASKKPAPKPAEAQPPQQFGDSSKPIQEKNKAIKDIMKDL